MPRGDNNPKVVSILPGAMFFNGVAIFTNLLPLSRRWDRTPTCVGGDIPARIGIKELYYLSYEISTENTAKAVCIPNLKDWDLDLKEFSLNSTTRK